MTERKVATWIAPLAGHHFDLEDMPKWLEGYDVTVISRDAGYALAIPVGLIGDQHEPVLAFAEEKVTLINGIGKLLSSKFRPITLDGRILGLDSTGETAHIVLAVQSAEMRIKGGTAGLVVGGKALPDPAIGAALPLLRAASLSTKAYDALAVIGRKHLSWPELYLLFELVQSEVGGQMHELGWVSKAEANHFCHTANSYSALRSEGRHGRDLGRAPESPMEQSAAVAMIRALVLAWLGFRNQNAK